MKKEEIQAAIELLEGKRINSVNGFEDAHLSFRIGRNALIDELIKEIE